MHTRVQIEASAMGDTFWPLKYLGELISPHISSTLIPRIYAPRPILFLPPAQRSGSLTCAQEDEKGT